MEDVVKNMQLLAQHQVFQDTETLQDIQEAVEQLHHIPDEEQPPQFVLSGGGPLIAHTGTGNVESYSHSGSGHINKAKTQYIGTNPLDAIKDTLQPDDQSPQRRRLVLRGPGGIGKTQLAIAYAQRHQQAYESVLSLDARSEMMLKGSFRSMAEAIFDVPEPGTLDGEQVPIHARQWVSDRKNTRWLLIYDNYDDPKQFNLEKYYPFGSHGAIIVTTRRSDLVNGRKIRVQPIQDIEESLEILQTRSKREGVKFEHAAKCLAERLDGLPLALATAGAYLSQSTFTFARYLREYERRWNIDPQRQLQLQEYQNRTLYTTWNLSYTRLESEDPDAAKLLKMLGYFDHQNLWYELFRAGLADNTPAWLRKIITDDVEFQSVMRRLTAYCFLEARVPLDSWSMHTCVHDWIIAALNTVIDPQQYWYASHCVAASIDENDWDALGYLNYARLSSHASWLVQDRFHEDKFDDTINSDRVGGASRIATLLQQQVQLVAAEQMYQRALGGKEKALGADHTSTLNTVHNIGLLYADEGKLGEAEQMYQRALAGIEKALGTDRMSTLNTVRGLCAVWVSCAWKAKFHSIDVECSLPDKLNQLLQLALTWGSQVLSIYGGLGRALLWTSDGENARIAFQQQIGHQGEVYVYTNIQCDGCRLFISCSKLAMTVTVEGWSAPSDFWKPWRARR
ncbi:hypothetical protein LTR93_011989 [Exophiala xenobiotica]|nr:hypothetical protein LTR93_011989 [Exophiala xenobiotica]